MPSEEDHLGMEAFGAVDRNAVLVELEQELGACLSRPNRPFAGVAYEGVAALEADQVLGDVCDGSLSAAGGSGQPPCLDPNFFR
jgi:hypothetical protein